MAKKDLLLSLLALLLSSPLALAAPGNAPSRNGARPNPPAANNPAAPSLVPTAQEIADAFRALTASVPGLVLPYNLPEMEAVGSGRSIYNGETELPPISGQGFISHPFPDNLSSAGAIECSGPVIDSPDIIETAMSDCAQAAEMFVQDVPEGQEFQPRLYIDGSWLQPGEEIPESQTMPLVKIQGTCMITMDVPWTSDATYGYFTPAELASVARNLISSCVSTKHQPRGQQDGWDGQTKVQMSLEYYKPTAGPLKPLIDQIREETGQGVNDSAWDKFDALLGSLAY